MVNCHELTIKQNLRTALHPRHQQQDPQYQHWREASKRRRHEKFDTNDSSPRSSPSPQKLPCSPLWVPRLRQSQTAVNSFPC